MNRSRPLPVVIAKTKNLALLAGCMKTDHLTTRAHPSPIPALETWLEVTNDLYKRLGKLTVARHARKEFSQNYGNELILVVD